MGGYFVELLTSRSQSIILEEIFTTENICLSEELLEGAPSSVARYKHVHIPVGAMHEFVCVTVKNVDSYILTT